MAKGEKVAAKFETYVAGMENDPQFEAVSFFQEVPVEIRGEIKEVNKLRSALIQTICKKYGVKPLGAAAPVGKTLDKALIQTLFKLAKGDTDKVVRAYLIKHPAHEIDAARVTAIAGSTEDAAKALLAQV
jgi:hypothetical protein